MDRHRWNTSRQTKNWTAPQNVNVRLPIAPYNRLTPTRSEPYSLSQFLRIDGSLEGFGPRLSVWAVMMWPYSCARTNNSRLRRRNPAVMKRELPTVKDGTFRES